MILGIALQQCGPSDVQDVVPAIEDFGEDFWEQDPPDRVDPLDMLPPSWLDTVVSWGEHHLAITLNPRGENMNVRLLDNEQEFIDSFCVIGGIGFEVFRIGRLVGISAGLGWGGNSEIVYVLDHDSTQLKLALVYDLNYREHVMGSYDLLWKRVLEFRSTGQFFLHDSSLRSAIPNDTSSTELFYDSTAAMFYTGRLDGWRQLISGKDTIRIHRPLGIVASTSEFVRHDGVWYDRALSDNNSVSEGPFEMRVTGRHCALRHRWRSALRFTRH